MPKLLIWARWYTRGNITNATCYSAPIRVLRDWPRAL